MLPVRWLPVLGCTHVFDEWYGDDVQELGLPLPAVMALERYFVAADLAHQVGQQGRRQPLTVWRVGAVLADDGR